MIMRRTRKAFYAQEDSFGRTGEPGQVRSYETGARSYMDDWKEDAKEMGMSLKKYLRYYFDELNDGGLQFTWQTLGSGYGFHGTTVCSFPNSLTGGRVRVKEIWDSVMIDESWSK